MTAVHKGEHKRQPTRHSNNIHDDDDDDDDDETNNILITNYTSKHTCHAFM